MSRLHLKVLAAKNAVSTWLSLLTNLVVGFFLAPFILHRLGDDAFGLWILIFSLTGYYGLFDLGIRSSIIKYVAQFAATGEQDKLTRFVNTSLFVYSAVGLFSLLVTGVGSWYVGSLFRIPPGALTTARLLFLMVGSALALGFPLSVFSGILEGLQQYWWQNLTQISSSLLRALLIVIALERGGGLLTIGLITVTLPLLASVVHILIVYRLMPIRLGRMFIDRAAFGQMMRYGSTTFVSITAGALRYRSDAAVIGIFLSAVAITFFSIGSKLAEYTRSCVEALAWVFTPMSSHLEARGDLDGLRKIFVLGNRACAMISFPICAVLIILGKPLISIWVGAKYATSYSILVLLIVPQALELAQATSPKILYGMGRHQMLSLVRVIEGIANLIVSIVLLHFFGIVGVALGTAIPLLCTTVFFLPRHLCKILNMRLTTFLSQAYLPPLGLCGPLVVVLLLLRHSFQPHNYPQLLLQVGIGGFVYSIGLFWFLLTKDPIGVQFRARLLLLVNRALSR